MLALYCRMKAFTVLLLLAVVFLVGCATTVDDRKKERFAAYSELPPETQSLVDSGQIKVGMPKDAVYIAWGKPDQITRSESEQGQTETWSYHGSVLRPYHYWNYGYDGYYPYYGFPYLDTDWYPQYYVSAEVTFQNDRVVNWRSLPRPAY
jgi:hypothetical protein